MVGTPHLDFKELENTTQYIGTATATPYTALTLFSRDSYTFFGCNVVHGEIEL
jgi:hypothetical protein